ncbi:acylphosphatase [Proteinivorax tanatarense]|uniref:acylphosphatase n=1 Tax=Proteinivorax tanatarense TaxID=1260629 RepID=A0AAU7VIA6_9FIRM
MENNERKWLPNLENSIPKEAYGYKLCMYTIALEAWRRGLKVKFYNIYIDGKRRVRYTISNGEKKYEFAVSRGGKVTKEATNICLDKALTKKYLKKGNVCIPMGYKFNKNDSLESILQQLKNTPYPLVVKPVDSSAGRGVFTNITNNEELVEAITTLTDNLKVEDIIVEQYVQGSDYRIYVIGDKVVGAVTRVPAFVCGDGKLTVKQLIAEKNKKRKQNPYTHGRLIKIDRDLKKHLKKTNITLSYIPEKGERINLREKSNVSSGGEPTEITSELTENVKKLAVDAINAVPGLHQGAVDIVADLKSDIGYVLEINSKAQISMHTFPESGTAQDVPSAIIDYYFPETVNNKKINNSYFDFKSVLKPLENNLIKEVGIPSAPKLNYNAFKYTICGKVQRVGYRNWVVKKAGALQLNGFVQNIENGSVQIIVSGKKNNLEEFDKIISDTAPRKANVQDVTCEKYSRPVKLGFEIIRPNLTEKQVDRLIYENISLKKEYRKLLKKYNRVLKKYNSVLKSRAWKSIEFFRKLLGRS